MHMVFQEYLKNHYLGISGDIGISSPRKSQYQASGGVLFLKNKKFLKEIKLNEINKTFKWKLYKFMPIFLFNYFCIVLNFIKTSLKGK